MRCRARSVFSVSVLSALLLLGSAPANADSDLEVWEYDEANSWRNLDRSPWYFSGSITGVAGTYNDSVQREKFWSGGVTLSADYLERHGITFGYTRSTIKFKGAESTHQDAYFLSLRKNFTPDGTPGTIGLRLDGHRVNNNDSTGDTDGIWVVAPMISFLPYTKSYYFDLGYAYSDYQNNLDVHQLTPTFGFAFNNASDWVQLRGFFIDTSNAARAQGKDNTAAGQLKWTHWFSPNFLGVDNASLSGMGGERVYAVDPDTASVYNLADIQTGSAALDLVWRVGDDANVLLHAGHDLYENIPLSNDYGSTSVVLSLSNEW